MGPPPLSIDVGCRLAEGMTSQGTRWVVACTVAETVGMTAAAAAARAADALDVRPVALAVVVAGGLVEGTALGLAQSGVLAARLPALRRGAFTWATVLVAGLGWAAASAPAVLWGDDSGAAPPLLVVLLGAAGIGLVMGPVLGGAQALALPGGGPGPVALGPRQHSGLAAGHDRDLLRCHHAVRVVVGAVNSTARRPHRGRGGCVAGAGHPGRSSQRRSDGHLERGPRRPAPPSPTSSRSWPTSSGRRRACAWAGQ